METIIEINEVEDGYEVVTTKQKVLLKIDMVQQCHETTGFFFCNDDYTEFLGTELLNVSITDTSLSTEVLINNYDRFKYVSSNGGAVMFVNIETSKGTLQFVAYNDHNGWYGHTASVTSTNLTHTETL